MDVLSRSDSGRCDMVCQNCGAYVADDVQFCAKCGAQAAAAQPGYAAYSPPLYISRVQRHVQALGIWWCVYGAYRLLRGLAGLFFLHMVTTHGFDDWPVWMHYSG